MSDDVAIRFEHVGKMYKIFGSKLDNLLDVFNLPLFGPDDRYREFWALRDIDLDVRRGDRLGIIGRNGAGKSTLLKLVTQNFPPTEGLVEVNGEVQALLEIGGGLHPEFTGNENIRASLSFLGLDHDETERTRQEIAEFTELGRFLDQPFKTYSQGMQARLAFGIATAAQPEILIVDEILGAGDAYFFMRSVSRMRELISNGATVLLVSHSLDQVVRFCAETIWIDRGRIVMRGESTEVVKAYEKFTRDQEDRRLLARNQKARSGYDAFERDSYTDEVRVEIAGSCEVRELTLVRDETVEDRVAVGDAQDADPSQSALIVLEGDAWSEPLALDDGGFSRRVDGGSAAALFHLWFFYRDSTYGVDVTYRGGPASIELERGGERIGATQLDGSEDWRTQRVLVDAEPSEGGAVSRWRGEGSLVIRDVLVLNGEGQEQASFVVGTPLRLLVRAEAHRPGTYELIPVAVIYRSDGILVSNHMGDQLELELGAGEPVELALDFAPLNLGDGRYLFSVALYRTLSNVDASEPYDLLDRSFEFEVTGNAPFDNGIFKHSASWSAPIETPTRAAAADGN